MTFGEVLRYLLDCEEVTQKKLAADLNLAASTVGSYAQGVREPDFETLKRIAAYFGVTTDYLLDFSQPTQAAGQEQELLKIYRSFTPAQKDLLLQQARPIAEYSMRHRENAK